MELSFLALCVTAVALMYVPGYLALRALNLQRLVSLCLAPLPTLFLFNALAFALSKAGISGSWLMVVGPVIALCLVAFLVRFAVAKTGRLALGTGITLGIPGLEDKLSWGQLAVYVVVGLVVTCFTFIGSLGTLDAAYQAYDNVFHLGTIRTFVNSGFYSVFDSHLYLAEDAGQGAIPYVASSAKSFYPTTWHMMVAFMISVVPANVSLGANALNAVLVGVCFPVSMFLLLKTVFPQNGLAVWAGCAISVAFVAFPWDFLTFGPLYPNIMGNAFLPLAMVLFITMLNGGENSGSLPLRIVLFVGCTASLALVHTSAVFTAVVLLASYLCIWVARLVGSKAPANRKTVAMVVSYVVCALVICAIWFGLYKTPFMQNGPLSDWWPRYSGMFEGAKNIVMLHLKEPAQLALALLVLLGVVDGLRHKETRWLVASYGLVCFIFWADICLEGTIKHVLSGFWYTDSHRTAAMIGVAGIPVACLGFSWLVRLVCALVDKMRGRAKTSPDAPEASAKVQLMDTAGEDAPVLAKATWGASPSTKRQVLVVSLVLGAILCVFNFAPTAVLGQAASVTASFECVQEFLQRETSPAVEQIYSNSEQQFVAKAMEIIPEGQAVFNQPNDGSCFAWAQDGLPTYYRYLREYGDSAETPESKVIRAGLVNYATDPQVQRAVESTGIHYLIQLDSGDSVTKKSPYLWTYDDNAMWLGIDSVTDGTPGFEVVLSEGDMRLYKIVDVAHG